MKNFAKYLMTCIKGICMGAADVIPGVSGGTIAFMTGIYEELVGSINAINLTALKFLFTGKLRDFWKHINGNFLLALATGILISVFSLAKGMQYLLGHHPIQTWAFFFGLIVASSIFILKGVSGWKVKDIIILLIGVVLGVTVCTLSPTSTPDQLWFIFLCGAIGICAMILPGISGSFILLILGKYEYIMSAIADMNLVVLAVFACGAAVGLISFSKFLNWLLSRYHRATLLTLAGFIIGSLVKVWPWSNMDSVILSQFPEAGSTLTPEVIESYSEMVDMHIGGAILFAVIGFALVTGIEMVGKSLNRHKYGRD